MHAKVFQQEDTVYIEGAVVFDTVAEVQHDVILLLKKTGLACVNLSAISQVNSATLAMLIELKRWAIDRQLPVQFIHPTELLMSLAQVYGVAAWLEL